MASRTGPKRTNSGGASSSASSTKRHRQSSSSTATSAAKSKQTTTAQLGPKCDDCGCPTYYTWFDFLGCGHVSCVLCFSKVSSRRGPDPFISCHAKTPTTTDPKKRCSRRVTNYGIHQIEPRPGEDVPSMLQPPVYHQINTDVTSIDRDDHPVVWHSLQDKAIREKTAVISVSLPDVRNVAEMIRISAELSTEGTDKWSEMERKKLESIACILHHLFFGNRNDEDKPERMTTADDRSIFAVASSDNSVEHRFVHGFAEGKTLEKTVAKAKQESGHTARWESRVNTTFGATNMISHLRSTDPGLLKEIIGNQLLVQGCPAALYKLLNALGISSSQEVVRIKEILKSEDRLAVGWDVKGKRWSLLVITYDNVGFKTLTTKPPKYDQYTMIQVVEFTREDLIEWNIYPDPSKDDPYESVVSNENRQDWNEIKDHVETRKEFLPNAEDYNNLADIALSFISVVLSLDANNKLPSLTECQELLTREGWAIDWPDKLPKQVGARKGVSAADTAFSMTAATELKHSEVNDADDTLVEDVDEEEEDEEDEEEDDEDEDIDELVEHSVPTPKTTKKKPVTRYEASNATIDKPMHEDLNSKHTCRLLLSYADTIRKHVLDNGGTEEEFWKDVTPIMASYGPILCGDGSPAYAISTIKRQDPNHSSFDATKSFFGGFHEMLELHKKRGALFGRTHLREFFRMWRSSDKQLDYVMDPSDPNQVEEEELMYMFANYTDACRKVVEKKARELQEGGGESEVKVSPTEVVDHMVERARTDPLALIMLLDLRSAEVVQLMHTSESQGKADLFLSAMKLSTPFFASMHATKYVSMHVDFLVEWLCSTDAEKVLFAKAVLFKKTARDKTIFTDRFVEWMMKDLRIFLGRHAKKNQEKFVERVSMTLADRMKARKTILGNANKHIDDSEVEDAMRYEVAIDRVFCETLSYLDELNVWGDGPTKHVPPLRSRREPANIHPADEGEFKNPSGNATLNKACLFAYSIGLDRVEAYVDHFLKSEEWDWDDPSRPESAERNGISLEALNPLESKAESKARVAKVRATAVDSAVIQKNYKVAECKEELKQMNELLPEEDKVKPISSKGDGTIRHADLALAISLARRKIIVDDPDWAKNTIDAVKKELEEAKEKQAESFKENMANEVLNELFHFRNTDSYRECKEQLYTFSIPAAEEDDAAMDIDEASHGESQQQSQSQSQSQASFGSFTADLNFD